MRSAWLLALGAAVAAGGAIAACGSDEITGGFPPGADGGLPDSPDINPFGEGGGDAQTALTVLPQNVVLSSNGAPVSQAYSAFVNGTQISNANWSLDNVALGVVDATGLFTASGAVGGVSQITATQGPLTGATTVTVNLAIGENPGNVSAQTQTLLKNGGNADPGFKWLYPYDKTVFPRGLTGPTLQFPGPDPDAFYVHVQSKYLSYDGFFKGTANRIDLPPATWSTITASAGANDPVTVSVTKISGANVTGPIKETWTIAQGSLKGTVYYNSYNSPLGGNTGAILKMKVGQPVQVLLGGCNVCHSVSANGNVLAAMHNNYVSSATYDLTNNTAPMAQANTTQYSFAAIYPDGSKLLSCGTLPGSWPPNVAGLSGDQDSTLFDTKTGAPITSPGLGSLKALMPAFSPDGTKLAFNHYAVDQGHTLAVMDFANGTNTFSNMTDVVKGSPQYLGWPAFTPDSKSVLYEVGTSDQYRSDGAQFGDLSVVDVASKTTTTLDALNGMSGNVPYLPYGAEDVHINYEPTILPVASGGYYWVLFTSRRRYGNTITEPNQDSTRRKKLWVAAIDINAAPGKDSSHPAFYLPEQELAAGNMRGFWALDPCKQNGNSCTSGDECCGGFCRQVNNPDGSISKQCVPPPMGCAQEFEKCTTSADCCGAQQGFLCLNGHCASPVPN